MRITDPHQLAEAQGGRALAEDHPLIAGIVAFCCPERPGFDEHLEALQRLSKVRGLRRVLHVVAEERGLYYHGNAERVYRVSQTHRSL